MVSRITNFKPNFEKPMGSKPTNLRQWLSTQRIQTHKSRTAKPPWACWQGRYTGSQHFDIYGDEGFTYGKTEKEAMRKWCERAEITIPPEFIEEAMNDSEAPSVPSNHFAQK
jgi:hypothetical protein